jgi:hypothetical protein
MTYIKTRLSDPTLTDYRFSHYSYDSESEPTAALPSDHSLLRENTHSHSEGMEDSVLLPTGAYPGSYSVLHKYTHLNSRDKEGSVL